MSFKIQACLLALTVSAFAGDDRDGEVLGADLHVIQQVKQVEVAAVLPPTQENALPLATETETKPEIDLSALFLNMVEQVEQAKKENPEVEKEITNQFMEEMQHQFDVSVPPQEEKVTFNNTVAVYLKYLQEKHKLTNIGSALNQFNQKLPSIIEKAREEIKEAAEKVEKVTVKSAEDVAKVTEKAAKDVEKVTVKAVQDVKKFLKKGRW